MTVSVILDTDIGGDVDDVIALAFCALHPEVELRCVTTVNGDTLSRARLARAVLDAVGRPDVPVGAGARLPLRGHPNSYMPGVITHGLDRITENGDVEPMSARELLGEAIASASAQVHVCVVGAATNVASVLGARPELLEHVACVHVMGGCLGPAYLDATRTVERKPVSEYNLGCDVDAAAVLWGLPVRIRLVPLDVTMPLVLAPADRAAVAGSGARGRLIGELMDEYLASQRHRSGRSGAHAAVRLHDPLAVAGVVAPHLERLEERRISIAGPPAAVRTVESPHGRPVWVCRGADEEALRRLLVDTLTR